MDVKQVNACRNRFSQSFLQGFGGRRRQSASGGRDKAKSIRHEEEEHGDTILGKYGNEINFYSMQTLPAILDPPGYCFVLNGGI